MLNPLARASMQAGTSGRSAVGEVQLRILYFSTKNFARAGMRGGGNQWICRPRVFLDEAPQSVKSLVFRANDRKRIRSGLA